MLDTRRIYIVIFQHMPQLSTKQRSVGNHITPNFTDAINALQAKVIVVVPAK